MVAASATGEKFPMFIIGKSKNSRCFKNIKRLPCQYVAQKKISMNGQIFIHWVRKLDQKFCLGERKIALIIDNCIAHPSISNLANILLVLLPPNTMSILQPMDDDVIRSLKAHYGRVVVHLLCRALEKNEPYSKISILQAMKILADSWEAVTKEIVIICFKKSEINPAVQQAAIADSDDPFKDIHQKLNELKSADRSIMSEDVTAESIVSLDDDVKATAPEIAESDVTQKLCFYQQTEVEQEETTKIQLRNRLFKAEKSLQGQNLNLP